MTQPSVDPPKKRKKKPQAPSEKAPPSPAAEAKPEDTASMSIWEHIEELRSRLIRSVLAFMVGCLVAWELKEKILAVLLRPFDNSWHMQKIPGAATLNFQSPQAGFLAYVKLAMIGGAALSAPVIFYQLWSFVAPGLYAKEKKFVIPFAFFSTLLFVGGGFFGWRLAFPLTFNYFLSMSGPVEHVMITPTVMMGEYIDFVAQMLLGFGIVFEIPLFILFLCVAGIVNYLQLITFARWYILGAFIVAAIITPPDVTSMCVMAVPMCLLYGLSIGLAYFFGKAPTDAQREAFRNRKKKKKAEA